MFKKLCKKVGGKYIVEEGDEMCNFADDIGDVDALTFIVEDRTVIGDVYANVLNMEDWWQDGKHEIIKTDEETMKAWMKEYWDVSDFTGYALERPEGRETFVVTYIKHTATDLIGKFRNFDKDAFEKKNRYKWK